jgi:[ribosomal protein S5]-alanine N-acetyltransferase
MMWIEPASVEHASVFAEWRKSDRLEAQTCRPILAGTRVTLPPAWVTLAFFSDQIAEPIGRFTYFDVNPRNQSAEFGYTVAPQCRNQGIGTAMLRMAIDQLFHTHLFGTMTLNKLYCQTGAFNLPSIKLLEKLNFHRDGILREHHELDGKLWDDYIYCVLRREWSEKL